MQSGNMQPTSAIYDTSSTTLKPRTSLKNYTPGEKYGFDDQNNYMANKYNKF